MTEYRPVEKSIAPGFGDNPDTIDIPSNAIHVDVKYETPDGRAKPDLRVTVRYLEPVSGGDGS